MLDHAIVIGKYLHKRRMKADYTGIQKPASRLRRPSHNLKLIGIEHDRIELP